jgi:hypothetical protein
MSDGALDERIVLANEFTEVWVQKVRTRNGERLRIFSPRLGFQIDLDPLELESLTWQGPETFSRFLETPFGPGAEMRARPLSDLLLLGGDE